MLIAWPSSDNYYVSPPRCSTIDVNFITESEGIMSEKNAIGGKGILVAAVVGAAVGAGVALLFAPGSGKETREWLAHRTRKLKDATVTAYAESKDTIQRAAETIGSDGDGTMTPHARPMSGKSGTPSTRS